MFKKVSFIALAMSALVGISGPVNANVLVTPTRLVLDESNTSASIVVSNRSDSANSFRIDWFEMRQKEDGSYDRIAEGRENVNSPLVNAVRFSPRRTQLAPGEAQSVRAILRPGELARGEYRAHMAFLGDPRSFLDTAGEVDPSQDIGISLDVVFGVSIPVIVRIGDLEKSRIVVKDVRLEQANDRNFVVFSMERVSGETSVLSNVKIFDGSGTEIGLMRNVNLFLDVDTRAVRIPVERAVSSSNLNVVIYDSESDGEFGTIIAESRNY